MAAVPFTEKGMGLIMLDYIHSTSPSVCREERSKNKRKREERRERDRTVEEIDSDLLDPLIERPPKKAKLNNHTAQLTVPPPPPEPPVDPDVATDFTLPTPVVPNLRPTLGLWGEDSLLHSMPSTTVEVIEDFTNVKPAGTQVKHRKLSSLAVS